MNLSASRPGAALDARRRANPIKGRFAIVVLLLLGFVGVVFSVPAADWPRFLGPQGNGISSETGLLTQWPAKGPPVVWTKAVGTGYSAPSVRAGRLVLHHRLRDEEIVECFDVASGRSLWRHGYPSSYVDPFGYNNGPRCTPLLTEEHCYTFGAEGKLLCLDLETGRKVWERDTAREWEVPEAFFGVGSTPQLEGDKLIVMIGGQPDAGVVALDAKTGRTVWESVGKKTWDGVTTTGWRAEIPYRWTGSEKQASYASPVAATIHGVRHLFCFMRQGLVSLDPDTGKVRFVRWFQSIVNESVNAMTPVVHQDMVLISAAYYRVGAVLLRVKPDGTSFEEVWRIPRHPMDPSERDSETGRWRQPVLEMHWTTPILHDGHLYAFSGRNEPDATFRCVEFRTGKLMWSRDEQWGGQRGHGMKAQPPVYGRGSAILADGRLIVLGEGGLLGLFEVNPEKPVEISRWQVPQLHYPCWAAPILSAKRLFLRSEDQLVCLYLGPR